MLHDPDLVSALKFAATLPEFAQLQSTQQSSKQSPTSCPSEKSKLKISGFMNIARHIDLLKTGRSIYMTMEGTSYIDEWLVLQSKPAFSIADAPRKGWRMDIEMSSDEGVNIQYIPPLGVPLGTGVDNLCSPCNIEHCIGQDSVHLTNFSDDLNFAPVFCMCHLPEDYEDDDRNVGQLQSPDCSLVPSMVSDYLTTVDGVAPPKSIYDVDTDRGQFVECSVGLGGCNGWIHARCAGLGHLTETEICLLDDVVCPLCVWYLEGCGDHTQLENKKILRVPDIYCCPQRMQLNGLDVWESAEAHTTWGWVDQPSMRYRPLGHVKSESDSPAIDTTYMEVIGYSPNGGSHYTRRSGLGVRPNVRANAAPSSPVFHHVLFDFPLNDI